MCGLSGPTRLVIWNLCPPSLLFKKSCPLGLLLFFIFLDFLLDWSRSVNQYLHIVLRLFYWWILMYRFCRLHFVLSLCNSGRKHSYVGQLASTNTLKSMIKQPYHIIWKLNMTLRSYMIFKTDFPSNCASQTTICGLALFGLLVWSNILTWFLHLSSSLMLISSSLVLEKISSYLFPECTLQDPKKPWRQVGAAIYSLAVN